MPIPNLAPAGGHIPVNDDIPLNRQFPEWHRGLGTTYHEAGTLWMGDSPATSSGSIRAVPST